MRIKTAIDWWFHVIIWFSIALMAVCIISLPPKERFIGYVIGILMIGFMLWIYFGTYYEFRDEYLYCRSGPFFEKIYYDKIKSVRLSNSPLASMALSTKRIEIKQHGKGFITGTTLVSPVNREEFIRELVKRCKNLEESSLDG